MNTERERNYENKYVLGLAFNEKRTKVLLILKNHPDWQKGFLNGIGGKIENKETPWRAMDRETMEETGLTLNWQRKGRMAGINTNGESFLCHIFYAYSNSISNYKQFAEECPGVYDIYDIQNNTQFKVIPNLQVLIPLGIIKDTIRFTEITY